MNKLILLFLFPLAGLVFLPPFDTSLVWEYYHAGGLSEAYAVAQTGNGNLVFAGYSTGKGNDFTVAALNQDGKPLWEWQSWTSGDDRANAIQPTFDGGTIAAGFVSNEKGKTGWLLKFSDSGEKLWELRLGDELHDVLQLADGSLLAVGENDGNAFAARVSPNGKIVWGQNDFDMPGACIRAVSAGRGILIGMTGERRENGKSRIFFIETDTSLKKAFSKIYPPGSSETPSLSGEDLVFHFQKNQYFIAAGPSGSVQGEAFVLKAKKSIQTLDGKPLPKEKDCHSENHAKALTLLPSGNWLTAGYTDLLPNGKKGLNDPLLLTTDPAGLKKRLDCPIGVFREDVLHDLCLQNDGSVLLAGASPGKGKDQQAWVVKLTGEPLPEPPGSVSHSNVRFRDIGYPLANDTLDGSERGWLAFDLKTKSPSGAWGLTARVQVDGVEGITDFGTVTLGHLPDSSAMKTFAVPMLASRILTTGEAKVRVSIFAAGKLVAAFEHSFPAKAAPLPNLEITGGKFRHLGKYSLSVKGDTLGEREEAIALTITVKNTGKGLAFGVQSGFSCPYLAEPLDEGAPFTIDTLRQGDSAFFSYRFKARYLYEADWVNIKCKAFEENAWFSVDFAQFQIPLRPFLSIPLSNGRYAVPDAVKDWMPRRGPNPDMDRGRRDSIKLAWFFNLLDTTKEKRLYKTVIEDNEERVIHPIYVNELILRARITSLMELSVSDIKMSCNAPNEAASRRVLVADVPGDAWLEKDAGSSGIYYYYKRVTLSIGRNDLKINIQKNGETYSSALYRITYQPPDVHFYSIGINHGRDESLHFSERGSLALSHAMNTQRMSRLYNKVFPRVRRDSVETTYGNLHQFFRDSLSDITALENNERAIDNHELIIVHIDTHGKIKKDRGFYLKSSNSKPGEADFEIEMLLKYLDFTYCRKIVLLLDACKSGYVAQQNQSLHPSQNLSPWEEMAADTGRWYIIASSLSSQSSWELDGDDSLSVFNKALLEAVSCEGQACGTDTVLTIEELVSYLKKRVPELARKHGEKHSKVIEQTPVANHADQTQFFINRNNYRSPFLKNPSR